MSRWSKFSLTKSGPNSTKLTIRHELPTPSGFTVAVKADGADDTVMTMPADLQLAAKQKHVMAMAMGPGKNLLSTGFMLWMSGSSVQIFSIMATGMALINPLKAIASVNNTFRNFEKEEGPDLLKPKLIFLTMQVLSFAVAVYKLSTMGLLPLTSADWVSYLPPVEYQEKTALPI